MARKLSKLLTALLLASACGFSTQVLADQFTYKVSVTNLTRGQTFTPILVATHKPGIRLFSLGSPASDELATLAEGGNTEPLSMALKATGKTAVVKTAPDLLEPGATRSIRIRGSKKARFLSMAAMLIPTNDAFVALNAIPLPRGKHAVVHYATAYDAGSEPNDEQCANIPGPVCGGMGPSPEEGGEGYVHIHAGIHSHGDDIVELNAAERDWRNPVALVKIIRVRAGH